MVSTRTSQNQNPGFLDPFLRNIEAKQRESSWIVEAIVNA